MTKEIVVIGAGLTGLATTFFLQRKGLNVLLLEKESRVGGAIRTHREKGYIFEEGPNTGVIGNYETALLFELLNLEPEIANEKAEKRLILKKNKWHPLPNGPISFFKTPLFTFNDKIKIAFEPLRAKGTNPDESIASLASRRIGSSFVDYAVNPFISGIYAGDPEKLVTRYALPKLYNLEQKYGSFIGGSYKKNKEAKSENDKKATRKVFSTNGGLQTLIDRLKEAIGNQNIICEAKNIEITLDKNSFKTDFQKDKLNHTITSPHIITTVGAHDLKSLLTFISKEDLSIVTNVNYAKVIQVSVGVNKKAIRPEYYSFGGLIPQKENKKLLGVLFPSFCFNDRAPEGATTLAIYLGGVRHPEYLEMADTTLEILVRSELEELFAISSLDIQFLKIFRHPFAIPQYEKSSKQRYETIDKLQNDYNGLTIGGNLRNGIGMADRIKQAFDIAENFI